MEDKSHSFMHNIYNWQKDEKQQISGKNTYRLIELPAATSNLKSDWQDKKQFARQNTIIKSNLEGKTTTT